MRFAAVASFLTLCGSVMSFTVPNLQNGNVTHAISVLSTLHSNILPHASSINTTLAGLGSDPTSAQKAAAIQAVTREVQGMTSALYLAIDAFDLAKLLDLRETTTVKTPRASDPVTALAELLYFTVGIFASSIEPIIKAFQSGNIQDILTQLDAPFDYLFFIVLSFITNSGPFDGPIDVSKLVGKLNDFNALLISN